MADAECHSEIDQALREKADGILTAMRVGLQTKGLHGECPPIAMVHSKDNGFFTIPKIPSELMDNHEAKAMIFDCFRLFVIAHNADAFIFGSDSHFSISTEKMRSLSAEESIKLLDEFGTEELSARGYLDRQEALAVTVETPGRFMAITQAYYRFGNGNLMFDAPQVREAASAEMIGGLKVFGTQGEAPCDQIMRGKA